MKQLIRSCWSWWMTWWTLGSRGAVSYVEPCCGRYERGAAAENIRADWRFARSGAALAETRGERWSREFVGAR